MAGPIPTVPTSIGPASFKQGTTRPKRPVKDIAADILYFPIDVSADKPFDSSMRQLEGNNFSGFLSAAKSRVTQVLIRGNESLEGGSAGKQLEQAEQALIPLEFLLNRVLLQLKAAINHEGAIQKEALAETVRGEKKDPSLRQIIEHLAVWEEAQAKVAQEKAVSLQSERALQTVGRHKTRAENLREGLLPLVAELETALGIQSITMGAPSGG